MLISYAWFFRLVDLVINLIDLGLGLVNLGTRQTGLQMLVGYFGPGLLGYGSVLTCLAGTLGILPALLGCTELGNGIPPPNPARYYCA